MTLALYRILAPSDFGLMAICTVFVTFLSLITELGLGAALVQKKDLDIQSQRQVLGLVTIFSVSVFLLMLLLAPLVAWFYEDPRLTGLLRLLSIHFLLMIFLVIPRAQLEREIDFKRRSIVDLSGAVIGGMIQLGLAFSGYGVWSLVWGNLAIFLVQAIGINIICPIRCLPSFDFRGTKQLFSFGGYFMGSRVIWAIYTQMDVLIAGKIVTKDALGIYAIAMHLASLPMHKLMGLVNQVLFPAIARFQDDITQVENYFIKAISSMAFIVFPVLWGISSIAPEITLLVLGESKSEVILPLMILSLVTPVRMLDMTAPLFNGLGKPQIAFENLCFASVVMSLSFLVGAQWGITGLSIAWLFAFPLVLFRNMLKGLPQVGLSIKPILRSLVKPVTQSAIMYAGVVLLRPAIPLEWPLAIRLMTLIGFGATLYAGMAWWFNRDSVFLMIRFFFRGSKAEQP